MYITVFDTFCEVYKSAGLIVPLSTAFWMQIILTFESNTALVYLSYDTGCTCFLPRALPHIQPPSFQIDSMLCYGTSAVFIKTNTMCIGAPIILGRCPSLSAHESESMLRTYLVCREKQERQRERERKKQTTRGSSTQCTITSTPEL
jgi:hypothetical protein